MIAIKFLAIGLLVLFAAFILLYFFPLGLWMTAKLSGVNISIFELFSMRLRKSPVQEVVLGMVTAAKAGVTISRSELEAHCLAGGNAGNVVNGLVAAKSANLKLSFKNACASDFQGIDLVEVVNEALKKKNLAGKDLNIKK